MLEVWRAMGLRAVGEAFADRCYEPDGTLRSVYKLAANETYFEGRPFLDRLHYRIFPAGDHQAIFAAFAAGQLEEEISSGSWFVFDALPGDAFVERPDDLWPMVLRRQGGILAAVAHFPPDVALN